MEQGRARQGRAVQDRTGQDRIRYDKSRQDRAGHDRAGQGWIGHWTAYVMIQRGVEMQGWAGHGIALHSMSWHDTANQNGAEKAKISRAGRKHSAASRPTVTAQSAITDALKHIPDLPLARSFISVPYNLCSRKHLQSHRILLSYRFSVLYKVLHRNVIIIPYSPQQRLWPRQKSFLSGEGLPSVTFHPTSVRDVNHDFQISVNTFKYW